MTEPAASSLVIQGRSIGSGAATYIVAEMSANHGQDFNQAGAILQVAKEAGADAVKLQTYTADTLTIDGEGPGFRVQSGPWAGRTLYDLYQEAFTPWKWQPELMRIANGLGLALFSTPFDDTAVAFLQKMNVPAYKIASFELVDRALLTAVARTGKPVIVSTGMATLEEIDEAVSTLRRAGARQIALLKCTSAYPAPAQDMNLRTISHLAQTFGLPIGLSDHTLDIAVPVVAVTLGACIVEKHLTLSRSLPGPDSAFSLEPPEFKAMVQAVRSAEKALGTVQYGAGEGEAKNRVFRRSLFVVADVKAGQPFTEANVRSIRPGFGLHPRYLEEILGRHAAVDVKRGTPLDWCHVTNR
jgi:pseudaminic acid synthase